MARAPLNSTTPRDASGVGTATSFLDFPDEAKSRTAAETMSKADHVTVDRVLPDEVRVVVLLDGPRRRERRADGIERYSLTAPPLRLGWESGSILL